MPTITRLVSGRKNPNRVSLYFDGVFGFALSLDEVVKHQLKRGKVLTDVEIITLKNLDTFNKLYTKILNYLSFRPHTISEVSLQLKRYGMTDDLVCNSIIKKLVDHGYLDDQAFARWFIASRLENRPRSKQHLRAELRTKGVSNEIINDLLASHDESGSLAVIITKKISSLSREKIISYLLRRGFSYTQILTKLDEMDIRQ